jgi:hypothetical protein
LVAIRVRQMWRSRASRGDHFTSVWPRSALVLLPLGPISDCGFRIAGWLVRRESEDGRPEGGELLSLSFQRAGARKRAPLLLGRSCVFFAKIPGFGRGVGVVSLWRGRDKKSFGCHALLYLGRCTFVAKKVKRAGPIRGRKLESRNPKCETNSNRQCPKDRNGAGESGGCRPEGRVSLAAL